MCSDSSSNPGVQGPVGVPTYLFSRIEFNLSNLEPNTTSKYYLLEYLNPAAGRDSYVSVIAIEFNLSNLEPKQFYLNFSLRDLVV